MQVYKYIYVFLPFDNFCRLKEYSQTSTKELNIPSYRYYFDQNDIEIVKISDPKITHLLKSVRIFLKNSYYINKNIHMTYGIDKFDIDLMNLYEENLMFNIQTETDLCLNALKQNNLLRDPHYINLDEVIDKKYFNLLGYIIYEYFDEVDVTYLFNKIDIFNPNKHVNNEKHLCAIRVAIHTDKGYITKKFLPQFFKKNKYNCTKAKPRGWDRVDSLENSILKRDYDAVVFLIREIGMVPTKGNIKLIKKYIPKLREATDLVF